MATRGLAIMYGALVAAAVVAVVTWPSASVANAAAAVAVGVLGAIVVILAVRRHRPPRNRPWQMLAVAVLLNGVARAVYLLLPGEMGSVKPLSGIVFALQFAMFVLVVLGMRGLARSNVRGWVGVIDAAVILLGAGLFAATFVALPYTNTPGLSDLQSGVAAGFLVRDAILVAVLIDFLTAARWNRSVQLISFGVIGLLTYDVLVRLDRIHPGWPLAAAIAVFWVIFATAIASAATSRSMVSIKAPRASGREVAPLRLGLLAVAALLPSTVLVIGAFRQQPWYQRIEVLVATVILVLVLVRITDVALRLRRQLAAEVVLRGASAELAAAMDPSEVTKALDSAVARLITPGAEHRLELVDVGPEEANAAAQNGYHHRSLRIPLMGQWLPQRLEAAEGMADVAGAEEHPRQPRMLVIHSDRAALAELEPRLEALAIQADVALERMRLSDAITRHTSDTYFRTLVHSSPDVILIVDDDDRIRYASPSAHVVFGPANLLGTALPRLIEPKQRRAVRRLLGRARTAAGDDPVEAAAAVTEGDGDWTAPMPGGGLARLEVSCRDLRDDPSIRGLIVTLRDVTERRRLEQEIDRRAVHDPLTGLDNRLPFSDRLAKEVSWSTRLTGVLYIDLDDLKLVNDGLGHETGDVVLAAVGERLRRFVAGSAPNMAARLGGDEFAVLLADTEDDQAAYDAADQLVALLGEPVDVGGHDVICGAQYRRSDHIGRCGDRLGVAA